MAGTHCSNGSPAWLATHPAAERHAAAVQVSMLVAWAAQVQPADPLTPVVPTHTSCTPLLRLPLHAHDPPLQALLDAGVTILGKNVMDEMVSIRS